MIESLEQLIDNANQIKNETERVNYVMNYFLQNVEYDYGYLLAKGYLQGTISGVTFTDENHKPFLSKNPFSIGKRIINCNGKEMICDDSYCSTANIVNGKSSLFDEVTHLLNSCEGDKDKFILELYDLFTEELSKHTDNDEIITKNVFDIVKKYRESMNTGKILNNENVNYFIAPDIKEVMLNFMIYPQKYMPQIIENGLIKKGVCEHYANYFAEILPQIGIPCVRIDGTSELGHAWNAAIVDGKLKSIDLTRAVFIRDKWKGISKEQTSADWLLADFSDTFRWQVTRTIDGVGVDENYKSIPLGYIVNGDNFNEEIMTNLVMKYTNQFEWRGRK